jgi:hypothetical protein
MNPKICKELKDLFSFVPPEEMRQSITHIYFSYLIHSEVVPHDHKKISEDIYFLLNFLEKVRMLNALT